MRAFVMACLAIIVIGTGGYFFLDSMQKPSGIAFSTVGARINPNWSWRSVSSSESLSPDRCETRKTAQWFFVDFGDPRGESSLCSISQ
jgi:hypothetical protein